MTKSIHPVLSHYSSTKWGGGGGEGALIRGGGRFEDIWYVSSQAPCLVTNVTENISNYFLKFNSCSPMYALASKTFNVRFTFTAERTAGAHVTRARRHVAGFRLAFCASRGKFSRKPFTSSFRALLCPLQMLKSNKVTFLYK